MTKDRLTIKRSPSSGPGSPDVTGIHDADTGSIQYIVACPETSEAALIDVVQGYDPASARLSTEIAERVLDLVADRGLTVTWVLDTHPHADHVMASAHLKDRTGAPNAIGEKVAGYRRLWRGFYLLPEASDVAPATSDAPVRDGDQVPAGRWSGARDAVAGPHLALSTIDSKGATRLRAMTIYHRSRCRQRRPARVSPAANCAQLLTTA